MNDLLEKISKLSGAQKLAGALGIYALVAAALVFILILPTQNRITDSEDRNENLIEQRNENRDIAENRERWERRVERLNEELARAVKELPNNREIPDLVRRITSIGKKIGLEFILFQPMQETPRSFYAEVPIKLKVEGSYHEVATFFDRVGKLNRIVNIKNISMHDPGERSGKIVLTTEGTAVTYRFLSEAERAAAEKGGRR